jgi:hypothetical protein
MNVLYLLIWKFKTTPVVRLNTLILKKNSFSSDSPISRCYYFSKVFLDLNKRRKSFDASVLYFYISYLQDPPIIS